MTTTYSNEQRNNGNIIPMFLPQKMEKPMGGNNQMQQSQMNNTQATQREVSFFDVKELYDRAYDHGQDQPQFKMLLAQAIALDLAYRRQLAQKSNYKDTSNQNIATASAPTKEKEFKTAYHSKKVAQQ